MDSMLHLAMIVWEDNDMTISGSIKLTVLFEEPFWVGIFEQNDSDGYRVARNVFGSEPTGVELYHFLLNHSNQLRFTAPQSDEKGPVIKKKNPKRLMREAQKEMLSRSTVSKAHETLARAIEQTKQERKKTTVQDRLEREREMYELKQMQKKQKKRGH